MPCLELQIIAENASEIHSVRDVTAIRVTRFYQKSRQFLALFVWNGIIRHE